MAASNRFDSLSTQYGYLITVFWCHIFPSIVLIPYCPVDGDFLDASRVREPLHSKDITCIGVLMRHCAIPDKCTYKRSDLPSHFLRTCEIGGGTLLVFVQ